LYSTGQPGFNLSFYTYFAGDEILAVNGETLQGMSHAEAIAAFKRIRSGPVALRLARRHVLRYVTQLSSHSLAPDIPCKESLFYLVPGQGSLVAWNASRRRCIS